MMESWEIPPTDSSRYRWLEHFHAMVTIGISAGVGDIRDWVTHYAKYADMMPDSPEWNTNKLELVCFASPQGLAARELYCCAHGVADCTDDQLKEWMEGER